MYKCCLCRCCQCTCAVCESVGVSVIMASHLPLHRALLPVARAGARERGFARSVRAGVGLTAALATPTPPGRTTSTCRNARRPARLAGPTSRTTSTSHTTSCTAPGGSGTPTAHSTTGLAVLHGNNCGVDRLRARHATVLHLDDGSDVSVEVLLPGEVESRWLDGSWGCCCQAIARAPHQLKPSLLGGAGCPHEDGPRMCGIKSVNTRT